MKNLPFLFISIVNFGLYAQNLSEINSDFNLSDSLSHETEVRFYQGQGLTNYSSLFRIFQDNSKKWTAEFYEHYAKVNGKALRTEKRTLTSKNDIEFVFQNFIRSHILDLPNLNEIQWKLVTRGDVEKVIDTIRGTPFEEYMVTNKKIAITDGTGFVVKVRAYNRTNTFEYSNPESYLKHYPEIDELIYICEILNSIRNEFGIWKN